MRGVVERRAVAIFRSRGGPTTSQFQSRSFSSGRGRGRDESEDAQGAYGSGSGSGFGLGVGRSGLGDTGAGSGRGRGRGSAVGVAPSFSVPSSQPTPFKPLVLQPAQPAAAQQVPHHLAEEARKPVTDSRFEDAITDKLGKPIEGANEPSGAGDSKHGAGRGTVAYKPAGPWVDDLRKGSAATWETRPRLGPSSNQYRNQEGSGRGSSLPQAPVNSAPHRRLRDVAPTAEKARASAWGSLSQILAAPGKIVSPPPPSPIREEPKYFAPQSQAQETLPVKVSVVTQVHHPVEVVVTQAPAPQLEISTIPEASQVPSVVTAEPQAQVSDASYVAMIKYHQQAGRVAEVEQIFDDMQLDAVNISTSTYNLLIQIFSEAGQFDKMDTVYKQMRQSMQAKIASQPKKEATVATTISSGLVNQQSTEVPVTLKEQVPVQTSPDLGIGDLTSQVVDSHVTCSDKLSARLGEWGSLSQQPAEIESNLTFQPPTPSIEISTTEESSSFKLGGLGTERPTEELSPGQLFAQRIGESEKSSSFRGLLKNLSSGKPSEDSDPPKIGSFNFFNLPSTPSPRMGGVTAGRGRGAPSPEVGGRAGRGQGAPGGSPPHSKKQDPIGAEPTKIHTDLSREEARQRAMALLSKRDEAKSQRKAPVTPPPPPPPPRPQLSREDARQRAVAVMTEGIERNLSREEERRRRGGAVESFTDAADFVASRFRKKAPDSSSQQQPRGPQSVKDRFKRQPRFVKRREEDEEPQVPLTLREMTAEDEKRLIRLEEEEQFKSSLHSKFLVDFEPEYAMEYFGINPDIDETPQMSLEETLNKAKDFLMVEGMTEEQWQGEVQDVLQRAPHLEKLVDLYAGENRMTSREQSQRLQSVADTMPDHVAPEIKDFMQRAMLTLQSNPGIRIKEKERLMGKFVSGLSSF